MNYQRPFAALFTARAALLCFALISSASSQPDSGAGAGIIGGGAGILSGGAGILGGGAGILGGAGAGISGGAGAGISGGGAGIGGGVSGGISGGVSGGIIGGAGAGISGGAGAGISGGAGAGILGGAGAGISGGVSAGISGGAGAGISGGAGAGISGGVSAGISGGVSIGIGGSTGGSDSGEPVSPTTETPNNCLFKPFVCNSGFYHLVQFNSQGCPVDSCNKCASVNDKHPPCRGLDCPDLVTPSIPCAAGQFLNITIDPNGCPALVCASCTPAQAGLRPGCRCPTRPAKPLTCPKGQFLSQNRKSPCLIDICVACTANTSSRAECKDVSTVTELNTTPEPEATPAPEATPSPTLKPSGCTEVNKPACPTGKKPEKKLLGSACNWVCSNICPPRQQLDHCTAGQYMHQNPAGYCKPWTCLDCDFQHRDLPACRPAPETKCQPLNWAVSCTAGQYRRAAVSADCLTVQCAKCADASNATDLGADLLPAECRRSCPEPLVLCKPGTTVQFSVDATGCRTAACRPCRDQEPCGAQPSCASRQQLNHEPDDCKQGAFYLGSVRIDGCDATVCLPCPTTPGAKLPAGCKKLSPACAARKPISGLPNCTTGAQKVEQLVDAFGCPSLTCADCPSSRPACPAGSRESPRPTKWLQCQLFDCRQPIGPGPIPGPGTYPTGLVPVDETGCPIQLWRPSPMEFGTEWLQLDDGCRLRRYRVCPVPGIVCRNGELPILSEGTCIYQCQAQQNWTSGSASCFPGKQYLLFLIDTNRAKSPFQIRFEVASFIARLAAQLSYGPNGVQIGAICYSGRVLTVINPDECATADAFFRRLLLLRYDEDASTATGEAVAAAAELLKGLKRPTAGRSVIVLTDTVTNSGRSLQDAAALLPDDAVTYFVSLSSLWNPDLRAEAEDFVSEPGNLVELTSYYVLATSGVQLLFPQCYRSCDSARNSLSLHEGFLRYLQDVVHNYEAWLYEVYSGIAQLQEGLGTMQYQFESKQIRLELCTRMIQHYKLTVQRLQEQLDSLHVIRNQASNVVDYDSSLEQIKQLELRIETLTVRKSQLVTQLQSTLVQISAAEDRLVALRKEQEEKIVAVDMQISVLVKKISESWKSLQTLTQELLLKRMSASNVEAMVQEKETRIKDVMVLNTNLGIRITSVVTKINNLKTTGNISYIKSYVEAQANLSKCEAAAALEGFSPLLTLEAGSGVRVQEIVDALLRGADYPWMKNASSAEMPLYSSLVNFTVGTYNEVKLLFRNSAGQTRAYLTFRAAGFDLTDFFDSTNLIASFPWRLETVKETLELSWSLRSDRFPSLLFSVLLPPSAANAAASVSLTVSTASANCVGRKGLLALVTDKDGCEDLAGPFPRMRFSPTGQPIALAEMEELDSLQLLVKPLAKPDADPNWVPGLVASTDMPLTLSELLSNGMLTYAPESAPTALRPGLFYKSSLLRSRPTAFPLIRLRLTDSSGRVHQLVYNGTFERDRIVESTWNSKLLTSARLFTVDPVPFGFTIGDATPCSNANATGVLYFNMDNRCKISADAERGWSVLLSPETNRQVRWSKAERAAYVEIMLRRRDTLASSTVLELLDS